jgi:hypothetical protein
VTRMPAMTPSAFGSRFGCGLKAIPCAGVPPLSRGAHHGFPTAIIRSNNSNALS